MLQTKDGDIGAWVLVTAKLALQLPASCCHGDDASDRSLYVLSVRVLQTKSGVGLLRLAWRCPTTATEHSQWFDTQCITFVHKAADANALLGRGPHEQPFEAENADCIELWTSPGALGRFTVAKKHIAAGECALKATAFAVIIKQQLARKRCHWCFAKLRKKAFQCGACEFALYCSRACLDADEPLHGFQCRTLAQLKDNNSSSGPENRARMKQLKSEWEAVGIDIETVRLALAVLSMENFVRTTTPLSRLVTNSATAAKNQRVLAQVAGFLVAGITSSGVHETPSLVHIQKTLERIQSNAHPLCLNGMTTVGVGLFPEAAMALNHSCLPNVVPSFDLHSRTLKFHAIREIQQGHAVEYSYIELFQATNRRQESLRDGFGFVCGCWRCVHEPQAQKPLSSEQAQEEAEVMKQLIQLRSGDDSQPHVQPPPQQALALADELLSRHRTVFDRSPELLFAYHMLQMKHAASTQQHWGRVISEAATLERLWTALRLPAMHPTLEILHLQVQIAAERVGDATRAAQATARVDEIRRICGYSTET
ncbi:putative histone tail methylase containing set domain [Globisporangium polare]